MCIHGEVEPGEVWEAIKGSLRSILGEQGLSLTGLSLVEALPGRVILRCSHRYVWMARAAIASVRDVGGSPCMLHVDRVSGTLRKLKEALKAR